MPQFFNKFPKIGYNYGRTFGATKEYDTVIDVTFRINIIRSALQNGANYYDYYIKEGETPEILADKIYNDPESHWIILYANDILDPQYDWPLDSRSFGNHLIDKYGSIAIAQSTYHHWEKVTTRTDSRSSKATVTRTWIGESDVGGVADSNYENYDDLAELVTETYNLPDGTSVREDITRNRVSFYDYEDEQNEAKRKIRLIRQEYAAGIQEEFRRLTNPLDITRQLGLRTVR